MVSENTGLGEMAEEVTIDLSRIPLRPTGKKEIQQLEMALIIATLYSPEVLELIKDPIERATWVDSLAVAAAALARYKAGYSISQIADEVGRSETMVRAHLHGKTKAGKLVLKTYEKLARGELKIVVPFIKVPSEMAVRIEELEKIRKELEERIRELEEQRKKLEEKIKEVEEKRRKLEEKLGKVKTTLETINEKLAVLDEVKEVIGEAMKELS